MGAWVAAGAATSGYSAVDSAISDLARVGAPHRALMTAGFLVFGAGVIAFGAALRVVCPGRAWMAAVATAACTIGVAATPLGGWSGDAAHATFAGAGYVTLVALPVLAAGPLRRSGRAGASRCSVVAGIASGACLAASTLGPAHGLWQRLGLTAGDVWIVAAVGAIVASAGQIRFGDS